MKTYGYYCALLEEFEQIVVCMGYDSSESISQRYMELKDLILEKMGEQKNGSKR